MNITEEAENCDTINDCITVFKTMDIKSPNVRPASPVRMYIIDTNIIEFQVKEAGK